MAGKRVFWPEYTAVKVFSVDGIAVYPLCSQSRPEHNSVTYSPAPVYGDVAGFQTKVAERMGKPCFECPFRCHLCCRCKGYSNHSTLPEHVTRNTHLWSPSRKLRAFSDIPQMVPDNKPRSNIANNTASSRKKGGFLTKSSRLCCLLIQNGVSVSQSMLSKIPTLSWVQSHVGAIMGRESTAEVNRRYT